MSKPYLIDRILHWVSAVLLLFLLLNMASQIHTVDYRIKGQVGHLQSAIQDHGSIAVIMLFVLLLRFIWFRLFQQDIPRQSVESKGHNLFIKLTHLSLYLAITTLVVSGGAMALNTDFSVNLLGIQWSDGGTKDPANYFRMHEIHLTAITAFWWLVGIHVGGVLYARR